MGSVNISDDSSDPLQVQRRISATHFTLVQHGKAIDETNPSCKYTVCTPNNSRWNPRQSREQKTESSIHCYMSLSPNTIIQRHPAINQVITEY